MFQISSNYVEAMRWIVALQSYFWREIGYTPRLRDAKGCIVLEGVTVVEVEHCLCEVDKWTREAMPDLKGKSKTYNRVFDSANRSPVTLYLPVSPLISNPPSASRRLADDLSSGNRPQGFPFIIEEQAGNDMCLVYVHLNMRATRIWASMGVIKRLSPIVVSTWRSRQDKEVSVLLPVHYTKEV